MPAAMSDDPYRDPVLYDLEYASQHEDVQFYTALARRLRGPVCELGCGNGRILLPIARAGVTFRYTAEGPQGLAGGKKIVVAATYGGQHPADSGRNFVEPYLRHMFGFLGIDDVEFVSAEGLNISPEARSRALETAQERIDNALPLAA